MDEILTLLKAGKTPESIYQDALAAVDQMNREKNNKKIAEARDTVVKALDSYIYALSGEHVSTAEAKNLEELLKEVEKEVESMFLPINKEKSTINKSKMKKTDDEIMNDFLKAIMK